jgi:hypothetical protein
MRNVAMAARFKKVCDQIFGQNAAALYGVDIKAVRNRISADDINGVMLARRADPAAFPRDARPHGPRTRREYLTFLRWNGEGAI